MKLKITGPAPDLTPSNLGGITWRDTRYGLVAAARPARHPCTKSELVQLNRKLFGIAGRMAVAPTWWEAETAMFLTEGTQQVPRDLLTMAALGRAYTIQNDDGTVWRWLERPLIDDPLCDRAASLATAQVLFPMYAQRLTIGDGWRLLI